MTLEKNKILVETMNADETDRVRIGSIALPKLPLASNRGDNIKSMIALWLPPEQTVFPVEDDFYSVEFAAFRYDYSSVESTYINEKLGISRPVILHLSPFGDFTVSGIMDNRMIENLWQ